MKSRLMMGAAKKRSGGGLTYATWNPLDKNAAYTLSDGNLTITKSSSTSNVSARATLPKTSGKWYVEITSMSANNTGTFGLADSAAVILNTYPGQNANSALFADGSIRYTQPVFSSPNAAGITGSALPVMIAVDCDNRKAWVGRGGTWTGNPVAGTGHLFSWSSVLNICLVTRIYSGFEYQTWNFGQSPFTYTPPSGFNNGWYE